MGYPNFKKFLTQPETFLKMIRKSNGKLLLAENINLMLKIGLGIAVPKIMN